MRHSPSVLRPRPGQRAFALILVLITLTLATVIVIFYLSTIARERSAVDLYAQQSRVHQLADMPVNLVEAQINAATREGILRYPISWASQPGMIRTYKQDGGLSKAYKLYSWDNMVEAGASFVPGAINTELPSKKWEENPSLFTDLNQPVNGVYPIADPAVVNYGTGLGPYSGSSLTWDFTEAFAIDNNEASYTPAVGKGTIAGTQSVPNKLPMPVKWVYVLQDGTWSAPDGITGNPSFTTVTPTSTNPIVGRIAFWADDETSKVNINTAGEGAYWDWPKAATRDEMQFAANPPAKGEFQRIAGHPSTTSLSAVFPDLRLTTGTTAAYTRWRLIGGELLGANPNYLTSMAALLDLPPRVGGGASSKTSGKTGSQSGTFPLNFNQYYPPLARDKGFLFNDAAAFRYSDVYSPVAINPNRLYVTPDEFWYQPYTTTGATSTRDANKAFSTLYGAVPAAIRQRSFFLTANSRAPETTLFETPRVSIWPITWPYPASYYYDLTKYKANPNLVSYLASSRGQIPSRTEAQGNGRADPNSTGDTLDKLVIYENPNGTKNITAQEQLLAFDATLNKGITATDPLQSPSVYYFQRQSSDSPTYDWTIKRNRQIANYLRGEMAAKIPGAGISLESKWDADGGVNTTDWITLNIMDYSRSMVNQYTFDPDPTSIANAGALQYSYTGFSSVRPKYHVQKNAAPVQPNDATEYNAFGVAPLRIIPKNGNSDAQNFTSSDKPIVTNGAYPTLKEVAVMFYATDRRTPHYEKKSDTADATFKDNPLNPYQWTHLISLPRSEATTENGLVIGNLIKNDSSKTGLQRDESTSTYPCNIQTTKMRAVMLFYFTGLRKLTNYGNSGINFNPTFWVNVKGDSFMVEGNPINLPKDGNRSVQWKTQGPLDNPTLSTLFKSGTIPKRFDNGKSSYDTWALVSDEINVNQMESSPQFYFQFTGSPLTVSLYAALPYDTTPPTTNPDMNPTRDPGSPDSVSAIASGQQLVAQYKVDFSKWNTPNAQSTLKGYPIPMAPYWNARQPTKITFPSGTEYAGRDAMPSPTYVYEKRAGNEGASLAEQAWLKSEIVPDHIPVKNYSLLKPASETTDRSLAYPTTGLKYGVASSFALDGAIFKSLDPVVADDPYTSAPRNWLAYAWNVLPMSRTAGQIKDNSGASATYVPTPADGASSTYQYPDLSAFSTKMENRVASMYYMYEDPQSGVSMFSSGLLGSGSGGDVQYRWTCPSLITPYDTVISMITDPNHANKADPRMGLMGTGTVALTLEDNVFIRSADLFGSATPQVPLNNNAVSSTAKEVQKPSPVFPVATYPRLMAGAQYHQLGGPAAVGMDTGYQLQTKFLYNGNYSLLGAQGGYMGWSKFSQRWGTGIGLETTPLMVLDSTWDWTSQPGNVSDGAYIQRPDQDYQSIAVTYEGGDVPMSIPYFGRSGLQANTNVTNVANANSGGNQSTMGNFFSPNRQIPSPIILGTIPSALSKGWQTLCFSPNPAANTNPAGGPKHPGPGVLSNQSASGSPYDVGTATNLPDHYLLDLLWMPVAEPYPISEQFSTAGKINLNYAMMPFPYIKRKTGMNALLKSVWIYALENSNVTHTGASPASNPMSFDYKSAQGLHADVRPAPESAPAHDDATRSRFPIHVTNTLRAFDKKFSDGDIFRSGSQICEMFLYPADPNVPATAKASTDLSGSTTNIKTWWDKQILTSDNGREEPYNAIYSRVTTKSNTFTVHWKVQSLRKVANTEPRTWVEGRDQVVAELRGSTLIERYLDPNANDIPDYAALKTSEYPDDNTKSPQPLSYYYKWRVATANFFQP